MIKEFLFFEPYDKNQMIEFYEMYKEHYYINEDERDMANDLIYQKKLKFNREKF